MAAVELKSLSQKRACVLSNRELEVAQLMAQGLSNKEIALRLVVGTETVKTHVKNIFAKLGAKNRTEAALMINNLQLDCPLVKNMLRQIPPPALIKM